ncbi:hypothetical protein RSOLAG22IIIB_13540 [Rhizoctonia solani]|uniref:Uncharacterized protein n=1 Tax=Rhizoctonia solani TaxID=456999 RepID=A0A0K6FNG2_9AGAM|nr:hypothetical protein RSOLAG22IIIB_13540 [Rhizoctonia solani]
MSQTPFPLDHSQAQLLLSRVTELLHDYPLESSVALAATSLGAYAFKHLITPSQYPNIDGPPSSSFAFGNLYDIYSGQAVAFHDGLQDKYGSVSKVKGMFGKENLFVSDPRFLHEVLVKGVDTTFRHPNFAYDITRISFGPGLLSSTGDLHKAQRKMLNPVFTAKHMKSLTPIFDKIAQLMKHSIIKEIGNMPGKEVDMLQWCGAAALELIGQAGLGHTFGVLEGVDSEYSRAVKEYLPALFKVMPLKAFFPLFHNLKPTALQRKLADWAPMPYVRKMKAAIDVQDQQAQIILEKKKKDLNDGPATAGEESHDIMSILPGT